MIFEAIKIGLLAGVAILFAIAGFICAAIAIGVILDLICLPFRVAKKILERHRIKKMTEEDPIFSRFGK